MKTEKKILVLVICFILLLMNSLSYANNKAKKLGEQELTKYVVKCGEHWYIKRVTRGIVELFKERITYLKDYDLSESDILNGYKYKGILIFTYIGPSRIYDRNNNKWTEWQESNYEINILIVLKNNEWKVEKSTDLFKGGTYTNIYCGDVPTNATGVSLLDGFQKQRIAMKAVSSLTAMLMSYLMDNRGFPEQKGRVELNSSFCKSVIYIKNFDIIDPWGNPYQVFCGKSCNGLYGIQGASDKDILVLSLGADGKSEFDRDFISIPLIGYSRIDNFNINLAMFNGSWIRIPASKR